MTLKPLFRVAAFAAAFALLPAPAQAYPDRPITIIVPFTAGGGGDVVARIVANSLGKVLGQQVLVENITGAGGTIGIRRAAVAAPDGYTMATTAPGTHSAAPALYKDLGYDPVDGFEMVGTTGASPIVLIARGKIPAKGMKEFVAYVKANEKTVTLAHVGPGSMTHLSCSMFNALIDVNPTAVPYRGTPPLMQDLLGDRVDYTCQQPNGIVGLVERGDIHAYAVADDRRSPILPNVPTADEVGMPGFKSTAWAGLVMPKGTPDTITLKINQALAKALQDPELLKRYEELGITPPRPEQLSREYQRNFMRAEMERYTTMMRKIGVQPQ